MSQTLFYIIIGLVVADFIFERILEYLNSTQWSDRLPGEVKGIINDLTTNELVAVLAHEIGHYKKNHVIWSLLFGIIQTGIVLFFFSLFVDSPELSVALGVETPSFHIGLIAFGVLYSPISMVTGLAMNIT